MMKKLNYRIIFIVAIYLLGNELFSQIAETVPNSIFLEISELIHANVNEKTEFSCIAGSPDTRIIEYQWDFDGDGNYEKSTTIPTASYAYGTNGIKKARVKAIGENSISTFRFFEVNVGNVLIKEVERNYSDTQLISVSSTADGIQRNHAILIGGSDSQRWATTVDFYNLLNIQYLTSEDDIYVLNPTDITPPNNQNIVDFPEANSDDLEDAIVAIADKMDDDDLFILFIEWHGNGYLGIAPYKPRNVGIHGTFGSLPFTSGPGDEIDYKEDSIDVSIMCGGGGYYGRDYHYGLDSWGVIDNYTLVAVTKPRSLYRWTAKSSFSNLFVVNDGYVNDSDVYIEKFIDYAIGDTNKDGIIDSNETWDYDNDGIFPFNGITGVFDEDDWGPIDEMVDNCTDWHQDLIYNIPYVLFDNNFDNKIDIDLNATMNTPIAQLVVDGTDEDNNGCIDNLDLNEDGDWDDWISVNETISLHGEVISDDELKDIIDLLGSKKKLIISNTCHAGGLLDDLSGPNTIGMAGCEDITSCSSNFFSGDIMEAFSTINADDDSDDKISCVEAFNYATYDLGSLSGLSDVHVYDDNGDNTVNEYPIPSGGDGTLGDNSFLLFPYFCPTSENQNLSGSVSATTKTVEAKTSITSTEILTNSSDVTYVAGESITIQGGFQVDINSEIEIKTLRTTCWD